MDIVCTINEIELGWYDDILLKPMDLETAAYLFNAFKALDEHTGVETEYPDPNEWVGLSPSQFCVYIDSNLYLEWSLWCVFFLTDIDIEY